MQTAEHKISLEPPGGILVWLILVLELVTFLASLIVFAWMRQEDVALFESGRQLLDPGLATINTLVLLTSGYFAARSVLLLREDNARAGSRNFVVAAALGVAFAIIKVVEYSTKLQQGYDVSYSTFFSFYWLLTSFHLVHVLVGIGLLLGMAFAILKSPEPHSDAATIESATSVAVFWHMCDLIWVMVFPVLYLLH